MKEQEHTLILNAQKGDVNSFEQLIHIYDEKVMGLIYSMVNNTDDVKDIYQEVFIRVFKAINSFKFKSDFYTWLYRIVINQCLNFRKKKKREALRRDLENSRESENWIYSFKNPDRNPEEEMLNKELAFILEKSLEILSPKQKMIFILRHYENKKIKEIAELMKISEGTVKNYLFRASEKLKGFLKQYKKK